MPFKANADRRRRIRKQRPRAANAAAYDAAWPRRGRLTAWFAEEAIVAALTLWVAFRLALRQTEGLIGSIIALLALGLAAPDHCALSRRAETLEARPGHGRA